MFCRAWLCNGLSLRVSNTSHRIRWLHSVVQNRVQDKMKLLCPYSHRSDRLPNWPAHVILKRVPSQSNGKWVRFCGRSPQNRTHFPHLLRRYSELFVRRGSVGNKCLFRQVHIKKNEPFPAMGGDPPSSAMAWLAQKGRSRHLA